MGKIFRAIEVVYKLNRGLPPPSSRSYRRPMDTLSLTKTTCTLCLRVLACRHLGRRLDRHTFDGTKWTTFFLPKIVGHNTSKLEGVVDFAPNNVWAVGPSGISLGNGNQSSISMVPSGASSPVPSFSPPTSPPWNP